MSARLTDEQVARCALLLRPHLPAIRTAQKDAAARAACPTTPVASEPAAA